MAGLSSAQLLSPNTLPRDDELVLTWPLNLETYNPALSVFYPLSSLSILNVPRTFGNDAAERLSEFEKAQLSTETAVRRIRYSKCYSGMKLTLASFSSNVNGSPRRCTHRGYVKKPLYRKEWLDCPKMNANTKQNEDQNLQEILYVVPPISYSRTHYFP